MITEDYVSFETAKLLKEKGANFGTKKPSLAMSIKWLRETHGLFIEIEYVVLNHYYEYSYTVSRMSIGRPIFSSPFRENFDSYGEACEDAIKYCLEELI